MSCPEHWFYRVPTKIVVGGLLPGHCRWQYGESNCLGGVRSKTSIHPRHIKKKDSDILDIENWLRKSEFYKLLMARSSLKYVVHVKKYLFCIYSFKYAFNVLVKCRGLILRVTSSEIRSVCVKQALNTRRWLVNVLVTWHVSYKITTLHIFSYWLKFQLQYCIVIDV